MQPLWTEDGSKAIAEIARRHGFGEDAGRAMAEALVASAGSMAQFHHPELGGMGQWSRGGMLMIGDMFNHSLKGRVGALADDMGDAVSRGVIAARPPAHGDSAAGFGRWWPDELGEPSSTGAQNGRRYAVFPAARRLAVESEGRVRVYDTGQDRIGGASQQQGGGSSLSFSTDRGSVGVERYPEVGAQTSSAVERTQAPHEAGAQAQAQSFADAPSAAGRSAEPFSNLQDAAPPSVQTDSRSDAADPIETIRKLATLKEAGVLTDEEFQSKKTELLARI